MGWSGGTDIVRGLIKIIEEIGENCEPNHRCDAYMELIELFEDADWDTQNEVMGISKDFDNAMKKLHTDWYIEEES